MTFQPAHKDCDRPAGQIKNDVTLADYIERKQRDMNFNEVAKEKKLTFEEWYSQSGWAAREKNLTLDPESIKRVFNSIWKVAQENV